MLQAVDRDIWVVDQPIRYFGVGIRTRMTVLRLTNRELVVISPIQIDRKIANQLNDIGKVSHIVAPNLYHYLFANNFKTRYPQAIFWAAPGLAAKEPQLLIDRTLNAKTGWSLSELEFAFFDGFRTIGPRGFDPLNECVFFHPKSRTLILTDAAFNFDESFPLPIQLITKIGGGYKSLSPSLLEKIATTDKQKVSRAVETVLSWNFERVIVAHGAIVETNGKEKFRNSYERFLGKASGRLCKPRY